MTFQLTQLDMQVQEFRNGTEKRNIELENLLDSTQIQLKERTQQVGKCYHIFTFRFSSPCLFSGKVTTKCVIEV